jgi:[protein-PII] uridylyltransferase
MSQPQNYSLLEYGRKLHRTEMQRLKMKHRSGVEGRQLVLARSRLMDLLVSRVYRELWSMQEHRQESGVQGPQTLTPAEVEAITAYGNQGSGDVNQQKALRVDRPSEPGDRHPQGVAIVALGGYGRKELAPYSDVDLMFLRRNRQFEEQIRQIQEMICLLWDMGFQVGHSVRTIKEALNISRVDLVSQISMLDARFITGDHSLFEEFSRQMDAAIHKQRNSFFRRLRRSIEERYSNQGGTAFIQEPDIKDAKGGLRDFHCVLWLARVFYPSQTLPEVLAQYEISPAEWKKVQTAYEFLQRLRNELHFLAGRRTDTLSHALLSPAAKSLNFRQNSFQKDSESFLKHYYLQARRISRLLETVLNGCDPESQRPVKWLSKKLTLPPRRESDKAGPSGQKVTPIQTPEMWMRFFRYKQDQPSMIDKQMPKAIRQELQKFSRSAFSTSALAADFRAILRNKGKVAPVIHLMHEVGFLGRVLPEFGRLTCFVQHDLYHKYTTDEHTLRALEVLDQIAQGPQPHRTLTQSYGSLSSEGIGTGGEGHQSYKRVLNEIHDSSTLYFALLMHDIGKGLGGGHSTKGALLVEKALERLGFDPDEGEKIQSLVQHHLLMGHVSQRRNLGDPHTIEEFVKKIDRLDVLNMLLLITYADAQAIAPGLWTAWKDFLLWDLYHKTYDRLMFAAEITPSGHGEVEAVQRRVSDLLEPEIDFATIENHFRLLPERYALYTPLSQIVEHLRLSQKLQHASIAFEWIEHREEGYTDLLLVTRDRPGLFAQIAGGLSAFNLNILSAQLNTRRDGVVFDAFQVAGLNGNYILHRQDYPRVEERLKQVMAGQIDLEALLKPYSRQSQVAHSQQASFPPRVRIDNEISPAATVIEVQAEDRFGLGYQIAKTLAGLNLNITFAKLATEKAHAFDVFYVQDDAGHKILDVRWMTEVMEQLRTNLG